MNLRSAVYSSSPSPSNILSFVINNSRLFKNDIPRLSITSESKISSAEGRNSGSFWSMSMSRVRNCCEMGQVRGAGSADVMEEL